MPKKLCEQRASAADSKELCEHRELLLLIPSELCELREQWEQESSVSRESWVEARELMLPIPREL